MPVEASLNLLAQVTFDAYLLARYSSEDDEIPGGR